MGLYSFGGSRLNTIVRFTGATSIGDSAMTTDGTNVLLVGGGGIAFGGNTASDAKLLKSGAFSGLGVDVQLGDSSGYASLRALGFMIAAVNPPEMVLSTSARGVAFVETGTHTDIEVGSIDAGPGFINFGSAIGTSTVGVAYASAGVLKVTDGSSGSGGISALTFRTASPYSGTETFGTNPTTSAPHATIVGADCTAPEEATAIGYGATADFRAAIAIGYVTSAHGFSGITIGSNNAGLTASGQVLLGSAWSATQDFYFGPNIVGASVSPVTWQTTGGSGADNAGATLNIASGKSTGSAAAPAINFQTSTPAGSSSTLQSLATRWSVLGTGHIQPAANVTYDIGDSTHFVRNLYVGTSMQGWLTKTLTESAATGFVDIPLAQNTVIGGFVEYVVRTTNGTDYSVESGQLFFTGASKTNGTVDDADVGAVGTPIQSTTAANAWTNTFTVTKGTNKITLECNSVSSLTGTDTITLFYRVHINGAQTATITGL